METRRKKRQVNGFLLLDKDLEISSNRALMRAKGLFAAQKAGHGGTLDPLATGMLLICFGEATKFLSHALLADKQYDVVATLGETTTTADKEGERIQCRKIPAISNTHLEAILDNFRGDIWQIPSAYSALKYKGKPYYYWTRQGETVPRVKRKIHIHALTCMQKTHNQLHLQVHCSSGTYIRNLVEDLGEALGCGAHVAALRRTHIGHFQPQAMQTHDVLQQQFARAASCNEDCYQKIDAMLQPIENLFHHYQYIQLTDEQVSELCYGRVCKDLALPAQTVCMFNALCGFVGIGTIDAAGHCRADRLINTVYLRQRLSMSPAKML